MEARAEAADVGGSGGGARMRRERREEPAEEGRERAGGGDEENGQGAEGEGAHGAAERAVDVIKLFVKCDFVLKNSRRWNLLKNGDLMF